ncbi:MAG TPA: GTP cyclohydrolase I FolE, partial [Gammaproteobacteria bacterium]|nr:GTP cyclohydrolase I FolE [Gammaproteobacteria bacterium]
MKENFAAIINAIGEDLSRPGLEKTPERAAKAFEYLTRGYHQNLDDVINDALFPSDASEMVVVKDIELYSMCE